jgi:hypothetical protein
MTIDKAFKKFTTISKTKNGFRARCKNGLWKVDAPTKGECLTEKCEAGFVHTHSVTGEWGIHSKKEPIGDERIDEILSCL